MPETLLHIPIFLASIPLLGYGALYLTHWTRFHTYRLPGQAQILASSVAGILILALARLLVIAIDIPCTGLVKRISTFWYDYAPFQHSSTLFWSVMLATIGPLLVNVIRGRHSSAEYASEWYGDLIERLLQECIRRDRLAELSLRNGKSYIGFVLNSGISSLGDSDIEILPLASGYRHPKTKKLKINTFYARVLNDLDDLNLTLDDFRVVLPMQEIVSARIFDPNAYWKLEN